MMEFFEKIVNPLSAQPHKMIKHTQTIRRLLPTNCLSVFDHFAGLALKGLKVDRALDTPLNSPKKLIHCLAVLLDYIYL